jgi:hypothetical protein
LVTRPRLVVWAWKFINFRPPLDQKGETVS